jgi:hypothetical protein
MLSATNRIHFHTSELVDSVKKRENTVYFNCEKVLLWQFVRIIDMLLTSQITARYIHGYSRQLGFTYESAWKAKKNFESIDIRATAGWSKNQQNWTRKVILFHTIKEKYNILSLIGSLFFTYSNSFEKRMFAEHRVHT